MATDKDYRLELFRQLQTVIDNFSVQRKLVIGPVLQQLLLEYAAKQQIAEHQFERLLVSMARLYPVMQVAVGAGTSAAVVEEIFTDVVLDGTNTTN